jgi:hypothetical protein
VKYLDDHTANRIRELSYVFRVSQADVVSVAVKLLDEYAILNRVAAASDLSDNKMRRVRPRLPTG